MLATLEGVQGSGKSMTSTALGYAEYIKNGLRVISNNHLNFGTKEDGSPVVELFDTKYFLEHIEDTVLENCILILDEAYLLGDSRSSASKLNKLMTYFVVQTRKRGVDLYMCTHHIDIFDKRIRRAVDVRGTCRYRKEDPCLQCEGRGFVTAKAAKKISDKKLALVRGISGGSTMPVVIKGKKSFRGRTNYSLVPFSYVIEGAGSNAKFVVEESRVKLKSDCKANEWDKHFGILDKVADEDSDDAEQCPRCMGYGVTGWATTRFYDIRSQRGKKIRVFGPAVFPLYSTEERIPFTKKQVRISEDDL